MTDGGGTTWIAGMIASNSFDKSVHYDSVGVMVVTANAVSCVCNSALVVVVIENAVSCSYDSVAVMVDVG